MDIVWSFMNSTFLSTLYIIFKAYTTEAPKIVDYVLEWYGKGETQNRIPFNIQLSLSIIMILFSHSLKCAQYFGFIS